MNPVYDRRDEFKRERRPGLHALLIGVSDYPYLEGGAKENKDVERTLRLKQLTSTAMSAHNLYKWLVEREDKLRLAKLASVRLLLSPSAPEAAKMAGHPVGDRATWDNFLTATTEWREDAVSHKDNVTLFYFAGHGLEPKPNQRALLLEDFAQPGGSSLRNSFDFESLRYGMGRFSRRRGIAGTQFYFVDACQVAPATASKYDLKDAGKVFSEITRGPSDIDDCLAPTFYATRPGDRAHAYPGEATLFNRALIDCLNGWAGVLNNVDGDEQWCITLNSLSQAVRARVKELREPHRISQEVKTENIDAELVIHNLDAAPPVMLSLEIDPVAAVQETTIEIMDFSKQPVQVENEEKQLVPVPTPLKPHPYKCTLPAGYYFINARVPANHPSYHNKTGGPRPLFPFNSFYKFVVG